MEIFKLLGTIVINNADALRKTDETVEHADKAGGKLSGTLSKIGRAAVLTAEIGLAATTAIASGIGVLTKKAIENYAEYEQLVGGVETLFKTSSDKVLKYANNAYKTAGLSANKYMDTVTSFSASLLQSLGGDTDKAADVANRAIIDMSDNANKMGSSMESIQNAYQGFAKQNYTMLDNLKLGYGGTKEEMQRLLKDAEKFSGIKYDMSSYADIVEAIHVVQTEMGITGTTSKEASTTISGSLNMVKSAWQNILIGIADENADFSQLINNLVDSVLAAFKNLLPRVQQALVGIGQLIERVMPIVLEKLPSVIQSVLPQLFNSAQNLIFTIVEGISKSLPELLGMAIEIIATLVDGVSKAFPKLVSQFAEMIPKLVTALVDKLPQIIKAGLKLVISIINGITKGLPKLIEAAPKIISSLIVGIVKALPTLIAYAPKIILAVLKGLTSSLKSVVSVGKNLVQGLWKGIANAKEWVLNKVKGFGKSILTGLKSFFGIHSPSKVMEEQIGKNLALGVAVGITKNSKYAKKSAEEMGKLILSAAKKRLEEQKLNNEVSLSQEVGYWKSIYAQCEKGTSARIEAYKKYKEAQKSLEKKRVEDAENSLKQLRREQEVSASYEANYWAKVAQACKEGSEARIAAEEKYYNVLDKYKQEFDSYVSNIMSKMQLFEAFKQGEAVSGQELITNLKTQINGLNAMDKTMSDLGGKIGGTRLFKYLDTLGADNLSQLQSINRMSEEELKQYAELYDEKYSLAEQKAKEKLGEVTETVKTETKKSRSVAKNQLQKMVSDMRQNMETIKQTADRKFAGVASTVSSHMQSAVNTVINAVNQMNTALSSLNTTDGKVAPTPKKSKSTTNKTSKVKKNAEGGILTKPTIFGYTPSVEQWQLGGEAGAEAIAPISTLQNYVRSAVSDGSAEQISLLQEMIVLLTQISKKNSNVYMDGKKVAGVVNKHLGVVY